MDDVGAESPLKRVLARLANVHQQGSGYQATCPAHKDTKPSLSVNVGLDGRVLVNCFSGCAFDKIADAMGLEPADFRCARPVQQDGSNDSHGCTLQAYADEKRLPLDFLVDLCLSDARYRNKAAIQIPYRTTDGEPGPIRVRASLDRKGQRFAWLPKAGSPTLYGLDRLGDARAAGYVVLVEGESDCHTLWYHDIPAVGVPGAGMWKEERDAIHFEGIETIYVVIEPDKGGAQTGRWLAKSSIRDRVRILEVGEAKDPSGLYLAEPEGFASHFNGLLSAAPGWDEWAESHPSADPTTIDYSTGRTLASDVVPERVRWLWQSYIPLGKLTLLDGEPRLGKSTLTCDIAGRVTIASPMPDGSASDTDGAAGVVILSAEDSGADTIRPRLEAAGAELSRCLLRTAVVGADGIPRSPDLADLAALESDIREVNARLVIIDPLMAYVPATTNTNSDAAVRQALAPLAELADRLGVAILLVRHLNKAGGAKAIHRGGGSIGFSGAARSVLLVAFDPHDEAEERRILAVTKCNLARTAPSLVYHIDTVEVDPVGAISHISWDGAVDYRADDLLQEVDRDSHTRLADATDFLREFLGNGPKPSDAVFATAKTFSITGSTLNRTKKQLGIVVRKTGMTGGWEWSLPAPDGEDDQESSKVVTFPT